MSSSSETYRRTLHPSLMYSLPIPKTPKGFSHPHLSCISLCGCCLWVFVASLGCIWKSLLWATFLSLLKRNILRFLFFLPKEARSEVNYVRGAGRAACISGEILCAERQWKFLLFVFSLCLAFFKSK